MVDYTCGSSSRNCSFDHIYTYIMEGKNNISKIKKKHRYLNLLCNMSKIKKIHRYLNLLCNMSKIKINP